jgi:DNA-binding NarL/FixJ family response regulator
LPHHQAVTNAVKNSSEWWRKMISVFIADGSDSVREALCEVIAELEGVRLAGLAGDAVCALDGYLELAEGGLPPQVMVLDVQLAKGSGLVVLQFVKHHFPATRVIMLCDCASTMYRERCISAGTDYFFDKATEFPGVREVLRELAGFGDSSNFGIAA